MSREDKAAIARELKTQAIILGGFVAIFWILEIADLAFFRGRLNLYGIAPRTTIGLRGILFAPFLHANLPHVVANTVPFLVLGWLIMLREISDFFIVTAASMLVGGLGVWLFGAPNSIHIGASGVIFGYLGFLLLRGFFERSAIAVILSLIVCFFYGGVLWGVLPSRVGISWEGHLFGLIGGVIAARILAKSKQRSPG
ncbi:rhomboid family intramembrane serine protease [Microcoleus sp. FACHB-831]|jgi:membrane associated rhomboid family serine protease|uniref:rhomboid family intramembrane serine protease n=1 Tax=Microcoleus sp. FACHB-831 TaxID=2692827 RepID=UPI00168649C5|nr:rhomboid family intramembrane serine protease [Microcoleus sp. FACHB-831]MBD1924019.1 rhomboid family intramembrane serine protease [Microcoleus sp. FACHB-831]